MLDQQGGPLLIEVNHSPSMALAGNEPAEVEAKCEVVRAALLLGANDTHDASLCKEVGVVALHDESAAAAASPPLVERARLLFEARATSNSQQQWSMSFSAFAKMLSSSQLLRDAVEMRQLFDAACAAKADTGTGWDEPGVGKMSFFAFVESLLMLASRLEWGVDQVDGSDGLYSRVNHLLQTLMAL